MAWTERGISPWHIPLSDLDDGLACHMPSACDELSSDVPNLIPDAGTASDDSASLGQGAHNASWPTAQCVPDTNSNATSPPPLEHASDILEMHICSECRKSFNGPQELKRHQRCHSRIFECISKECNASFTWAKDLRRHTQAKHTSQTDRFEFICTFCFTQFTRADNLARHTRKKHRCPPLPAQEDAVTPTSAQYSQTCRGATTWQPLSRPNTGQTPAGESQYGGHANINHIQHAANGQAQRLFHPGNGKDSQQANRAIHSSSAKRPRHGVPAKPRFKCPICGHVEDGLMEPSELRTSCRSPGFEFLSRLRSQHLMAVHGIYCSDTCCPEKPEDARKADLRAARWRRICQTHFHQDGSVCEHDPYVEEAAETIRDTVPVSSLSPEPARVPTILESLTTMPMQGPITPSITVPAIPLMAMPAQAPTMASSIMPTTLFDTTQAQMVMVDSMLDPIPRHYYQLILENNMLRREIQNMVLNYQFGT